MKIINLTPPAITFVRDNAENIVIAPKGKITRVTAKTVSGKIAGDPDNLYRIW